MQKREQSCVACVECERRTDERIHQIRMQAENEVNRYKYELWARLRPDLDDLLRDDLQEDDFATPDRGRILFGRIRNIVTVLRDSGVVLD